ncbi:MAG: sigma-70 family polymerase sigma factor [Sphingomonadales bacterium]|nr:sigma-70 family polymerase sigma factor [Sphingomonadales bacterium]
MLLRLLAARLGTREDAEDAVQELWLKLADLSVDPVAHPAAYLYRMAANLASDRRAAAMSGIARDRAWLEVQPDAAELPDAERALIGRDRLRRVTATLDAMPDRMRIAFRMFRIEGQSQKKIAEALGISVSGVEKLLQRAYRLVHNVEYVEPSTVFTEESDAPHRLRDMKDNES